MDKETTEKLICQAMKIITAIYRSYDPEGEYLSLSYINNEYGEYIHFYSIYDDEKKIDFEVNLREG